MPSPLLKFRSLGICVYISIFLISSTKPEEHQASNLTNCGEYALTATGCLNKELKGQINFETAIKTSRNGKTFSTIKLKLKSTNTNIDHSMVFLVSKRNATHQITKGNFEVSKYFDSLLNYFDGAFGYANIVSLGELPFFAKTGVVNITYADNNTIKGSVNLNLSNTNGQYVHLKGDFTAKN